MKVLLIDNYDSFVHNLARYVRTLGLNTMVKRNDAITLADIARENYSHIIISPGPKMPLDSGVSLEVIKALGHSIPILGVCLGHQAIGFVYGAKIMRANRPMHGKSSLIKHDEKQIFSSIQNPLRVGRYHSLIISDADFPTCLSITARCDQGEIMAIQHNQFPVFGVQFHPESVLTEAGYQLLDNFLKIEKDRLDAS